MIASKSLVGKPIVNITDGRIVGHISDVYLDRDLRCIVALHVGHEGLLNRKAQVILRENVELFGVDTVLVRQSDVILSEEKVEDFEVWIRRDHLTGRSIDTPGGKRIARVDDVILDDEANVLGFALGFALGRTYIESPLAESGVISRDIVIDTGQEDDIMTIDLEKAKQEHFLISA